MHNGTTGSGKVQQVDVRCTRCRKESKRKTEEPRWNDSGKRDMDSAGLKEEAVLGRTKWKNDTQNHSTSGYVKNHRAESREGHRTGKRGEPPLRHMLLLQHDAPNYVAPPIISVMCFLSYVFHRLVWIVVIQCDIDCFQVMFD